ncbi:MAG: hypothetical protein BGO30_08370 [Bacteroidetes bacterium 41-46]|nr:MAG: hypothetical protein BGO30_08370 [Bacteroidetes bacterium 41-46]
MSKKSGYLVKTKKGKVGRSFHSRRSSVEGKTPVYLETEPLTYSDKAILCETKSLQVIGYID